MRSSKQFSPWFLLHFLVQKCPIQPCQLVIKIFKGLSTPFDLSSWNLTHWLASMTSEAVGGHTTLELWKFFQWFNWNAKFLSSLKIVDLYGLRGHVTNICSKTCLCSTWVIVPIFWSRVHLHVRYLLLKKKNLHFHDVFGWSLSPPRKMECQENLVQG